MSAAPDDHIRSFIERLMRLNEERQAITDDIKELCSEAKGVGIKPKALRATVAKITRNASATANEAEFEAEVEMYLAAYHAASHVRVREAAE